MSDARPRLEVVDGGGGTAPRPQPAAPAPPRRRSRAVLVAWALAGLLAVALVGIAQQGRRAEALAGRVTALEGELETAQAALSAHRAHMDAVRVSVSDLQALVEREPVPGAPADEIPVAPH